MTSKLRTDDYRNCLIDDGWHTPDTYDSNTFAAVPESPGVYLFLCFNDKFIPIGVGYVGCARNLFRRLLRHEKHIQISKDGLWPQRWFKPSEIELLRDLEKHYIRHFDPSYNVIGRSLGFQNVQRPI